MAIFKLPSKNIKLLVCGDRDWCDVHLVRTVMKLGYKTIKTVIHGNARGADQIAGSIAINEMYVPTFVFPANWGEYSAGAGPIRNSQMLMEGEPNLIIAFHNYIEISKGTKHMVKLARRYTEEVYIISKNNDPVIPDKLKRLLHNGFDV